MSRQLTIDRIADEFVQELKRFVRVKRAAPRLEGHLELNEAFAALVKRIDQNIDNVERRRARRNRST